MDYTKLAPSLAMTYRQYSRNRFQPLRENARPLGLISVGEPIKTPRALIFLECEPGASFTELQKECGVIINEGGADIRTGIAPIGAIPALTEYPGVEYVAPSPLLSPCLDVASDRIGLPTLRSRNINPELTGEDVVIGVVDSGVDTRHPAFRGRIERVWDQELSGGGGVLEGRYGTELSGPQIHLSQDRSGHGTHVTGIAAGAGRYIGVAPAARIIAVRTDRSAIHVLDGIRYIFRVADELGKPAVVNLSLGHHDGAHDGTDRLSLGIDRATGPGRIVCCAAGNEARGNIHAETTVSKGGVNEIFFILAPGVTKLTGWYAEGDEIGVSVVSPSGYVTNAEYGQSSLESYDFPDGSVDVATARYWRNGARNFEIRVEQDGEYPMAASSTWRIRLHGRSVANGRVDVWIGQSPSGSQFTGPAATPSMTISQPGDATSAITVAAYTTKVAWTTPDGSQHVGFSVDDICDFSSEGPRRDDYEKPNVAAPGAMIVSCLSSHSSPEPEYVIDDEHCVMHGTSMACPFVTGIAALFLQREPMLAPDALMGMLQSHSAVPGRPAGTFDPKWGYGLVDVSLM